MKSKHICPQCGGTEFTTVAHVTQTWKVDAYGNFIETVTECDEVTHDPDDGNAWFCAECGSEAFITP